MLEKDKYDNLRNWGFIKDKDKSQRLIERQKEIVSVARAKGVDESVIWAMGQGEYYNTLAVLESINNDIEAAQKKK